MIRFALWRSGSTGDRQAVGARAEEEEEEEEEEREGVMIRDRS